jgi:hypothetical protein
MKKLLPVLALFSSMLLASSPVFAWDGAVTGKIANIDVAPGGNFGFRVVLAGTPLICTGGVTWGYLNDTDSNYKVFVAMMMMAKAQSLTVTLYTTAENGYCHIGYIATSS